MPWWSGTPCWRKRRTPEGRRAMNWQGQSVLVTGGASLIGSHLVDALVLRGPLVRVVDNLSSGSLDNIRPHLDAGHVELIQANLGTPGVSDTAREGMAVVFHLPA